MLLNNFPFQTRKLAEMTEVLFDQNWAKNADQNLTLYRMYRGLKEKNGLRYDITVIFPLLLGQEYNKTFGHSHACQESYEILEGEAIFLLQEAKNGIIGSIRAIFAKPGDKIPIPANCKHLTINASDQILKLANWTDIGFQSDYESVRKKHGFGYYAVKGENGLAWIKNPHYKQVPELIIN